MNHDLVNDLKVTYTIAPVTVPVLLWPDASGTGLVASSKCKRETAVSSGVAAPTFFFLKITRPANALTTNITTIKIISIERNLFLLGIFFQEAINLLDPTFPPSEIL